MQPKLIADCDTEGRFYLELSDYLRYIFQDGELVGFYNPSLEYAI